MRLEEILLRMNAVTREQLDAALRAQVAYGGKLGTNLLKMRCVDIETLTQALSTHFQVDGVLPIHFDQLTQSTLDLLPRATAEKYKAIPLGMAAPMHGRDTLAVAMANPRNLLALDEMAFATGYLIRPLVTAELVLDIYLERLYGITRSDRIMPNVAAPQRSVPQQFQAPMRQTVPQNHAVQQQHGLPQSLFPASQQNAAPAQHSAPHPPMHTRQQATASQQFAPQQFVPQQGAPQRSAPQQGTPQRSAPQPAPAVRRHPAPQQRVTAPQHFAAPRPAPQHESLPQQTQRGPTPQQQAVHDSHSISDTPPEHWQPEVGPFNPNYGNNPVVSEAARMRAASQPTVVPGMSNAPQPPPVPLEAGESHPDDDISVQIDVTEWGNNESYLGRAVEVTLPTLRQIERDQRVAIDGEEALRRLDSASDTESIGAIVGDFLRSGFECGLVLLVKKDVALGWRGFAAGIDADVIESLAIPLHMPSVFRIACERQSPFRGAPPRDGDEIHRRVWKLLRCDPPEEVIVSPVVVSDRVVNLVYAHALDGGPIANPIAREFTRLTKAASQAYVRLIMAKRQPR